MNEHRGAVEIPGIGAIRYDWDAIGRLVAEFGHDFDVKITKASVTYDVDTIAAFIAAGSTASVADVKRASPPLAVAVAGVMAALNLAFHGTGKAPPATDGAARPTKAT